MDGPFMMLLFAAFLWTIVFLMFRDERRDAKRDMEKLEELIDKRYGKDHTDLDIRQ